MKDLIAGVVVVGAACCICALSFVGFIVLMDPTTPADNARATIAAATAAVASGTAESELRALERAASVAATAAAKGGDDVLP